MARRYREIWEKDRDETIPEGWHIHHLDYSLDRTDPDNMMCVTREMHREIHEVLFERYGKKRDGLAAQLLRGDGCSGYKWTPKQKARMRKIKLANREAISEKMKGNSNGRTVRVFNTHTGEIYDSISQAAREYDMPVRTLTNQLTGISRNKTNLKIVEQHGSPK